DHRGERMKEEGDQKQRLIANAINERAHAQDDKTEAPEPAARDTAQLGFREAELASPVAQNAAADGKADSVRENGHESGEKEPASVGGGGIGSRRRLHEQRGSEERAWAARSGSEQAKHNCR